MQIDAFHDLNASKFICGRACAVGGPQTLQLEAMGPPKTVSPCFWPLALKLRPFVP